LLLLALSSAAAQQSTAPTTPATPAVRRPSPKPHTAKPDGLPFNPNLIVLDPAHGGPDDGAHLPGGVLEKDVTVAFAARLRGALTGRGFTVVLTHESAADETSLDSRVETANRNRAIACILIHASNGGHGVHLFASALPPQTLFSYDEEQPHALIPWDSGQAASLSQSTRLESEIATAINGIRVPLVSGVASIRPIDSFACPAVTIELAPLNNGGGSATPVDDENYQRTVADALSTSLAFWRSHALAQAMSAEISRAAEAARNAEEHGTPITPPAPKPKPKPKPVPPPASFPEEAPPDSAAPIKKPAPIVRQPPPTATAPPATKGGAQ
jgi:N-acetylmuramoyl-L-alanine amidase